VKAIGSAPNSCGCAGSPCEPLRPRSRRAPAHGQAAEPELRPLADAPDQRSLRQKAKAEGYRSRAAYKLDELDERFGLLKGVKRVVDLGIAPGGWSQVVRQRCPAAKIVGIDLLPTERSRA